MSRPRGSLGGPRDGSGFATEAMTTASRPRHAAVPAGPPVTWSSERAARRGWSESTALFVLLIALVVLVANLPALVGYLDVNPLASYAGLTSSMRGGLLPGIPTIDINVGATSQALGHRAALDWLHGQVPWWNPYEGVGTPLAAGMQAAAFFPPTLLLAFSGGQLAFRLLLEFVTGLATFFLLRRLGTRPYVAAAAGMAFSLCGTYAWFQHAAINPVALLPAALLGVEVARDRRLGDWRVLLLPVALALSVTAGFPETAFFDDVLVVAWAAWRALSAPSGERGRLAGRLGLLGASGVMLAAPLILPFRSYLSEANVGAHAGMAHVHLPPAGLLTLIDAYLTGPLKAFVPHGSASVSNLFTTNSGYVLVSAFVLALAGLLLSRRDTGLRVLLALFIAVVTARDYGVPVVMDLFSHLPYVNESAIFRSAVPAVELSVVVLATFGIEAVLERGQAGSRARAWHLGLLSVVTAGLLAGLAAGPARTMLHLVYSGSYPSDPKPYVIGAVIGTGVILAVLGVAGALRGRVAGAALCGVLVLEALGSFVYPELSAPRSATVDMKPVTFLEHHLDGARFYSLAPDPIVGPAYGGPIAPNYGSYFSLPSVDYLDIPDPALFVNYVHDHLDPGAGSEFFGTLIGRAPGAEPMLAAFGANVRAFESIGVAYVVTGAGVDLARYAPAATRSFHDRLVSIWHLPHAAAYFSAGSPGCVLRPKGFDEVVATCTRPARIERQELALSGWHATVNGRPARLLAAHGHLFSAVAVPAGRSTVVWSYRPGQLGLGEGLAVVGACALLASFLWGRRREPGRREPGRSRRSGPGEPGRGGRPAHLARGR